MAGFLPLGDAGEVLDLNVGTTEPIPKSQGLMGPPLTEVKPGNQPQAIPDSTAANVKAITHEVLAPFYERQKEALRARQERAKTWPAPDVAVKVAAAAEAQGVPLEVAFDAPSVVGGPPLEESWADHAGNDPFATFLKSPDVAYTTPEGRRQQLKLLGWAESAIPGSLIMGGLKSGYETFHADQIEAMRVFTPDGLLTPDLEAELAKRAARAELFPRPMGWGQEIVNGITENAYQMGRMLGIGAAVGTGVGLLTGGAGALTAAAVAVYGDNFWRTTGSVVKEFREAGMPHGLVRVLAPVVGAGIAGLDTASAGALTRIPGLNLLRSRITKIADLKPALALAMKDSRFMALVSGGLWEGGTEGAQEVLDIIGLYAGAAMSPTPVKVPNFEESRDRVVANAAMGAIVGPFYSGTAELGKILITKHSRGTQAEAVVNRLYDITDNLELTEKSPEAQHRYVEAVSKTTGVDSVTLPAEALSGLYQASSATMPESVQRAVDEATATGGRATVSMADFITHIRPLDTSKVLAQEVGLGEDLSAKETKALEPAVKKAQKVMEEMQRRQDFTDDSPEGQIFSDLKKKLLAAKFTVEGAEYQARLLASAISVLAERAGKHAGQVYQNAMIAIERTGVKSEIPILNAIAERLVQMTPEQRAREYFIDANTGLKNSKAFELQKRQGGVFYFADAQGAAYLNDKGAGHGQTDAMYRMHAQNLAAQDPSVARGWGGFVGWAPDQASADAIIANANAKTQAAGFTLEHRTGATVEEAVKSLGAWHEAQRSIHEGKTQGVAERAARGTAPFGAAAVDPKTLAFTAEPLQQTISPEERAHHAGMTAAEALRVYVNPETHVLTNRGWAVARTERKKRFIMSGDAAGIGIYDRVYGKAVADHVVQVIEHVVGAVNAEAFDGAHPHGDEIMAQHNSQASLQSFGERVRTLLEKTVITAYDPVKDVTYTINGVAFSFGVGTTEEAAEKGLNADKERLAVDQRRDRKGEGTAALQRRISSHTGGSLSSNSFNLGEAGVVGRDATGAVPSQPAGAGQADGSGGPASAGSLTRLDPETLVPGFAQEYARVRPAGTQTPALPKGARGNVAFDPVTRDYFKITLSGDANLSTFVHESGHYLLELMRKLAPETPEIAADLQVLEAWAGVKPGEEWSTEALEKFARGFETYLGEGKAPSTKLAQAFATFKGWILHVYRNLASLNAPLTDEVRGVMDRLLANQTELDAAAQQYGYFPADAKGDGLDAAREVWAQARRIAQERMDRKAVFDLRKETTAEFKRFKEEAAAQIDKHPVMVARGLLSTEGNKVALTDLLDRKLTKTQMAKLEPYVTTSANGITAEEAAIAFGFKNGSDFIEAMVNTPERSTLIRLAAEAKMADAHPGYRTSKDWIAREALTTLHEEDTVSTALEGDLAGAYMRMGRKPPVQAARVAAAAAVNAIRATRIEEIKTNKYLKTEEDMHLAAVEAYAKKDFQAAADAMLKRIYARALWKAGEQALAEVDRVKKALGKLNDFDTLGRLGRSSDAMLGSGKTAGQQMRDALRSIAEAVGLADRSEASDHTLDHYLSDLENGGFPVSVSPALRDASLPAWSKLTVDQVMAIKDAIKNVRHIAKEANDLRIKGEKIEMAKVAAELQANLQANGLFERAGDKGESQEGLGRVSKLRLEITKPETIALDLDGGKVGIFHRLWIQSAEGGQFERDKRFRQRRADLRELGDKYRPEGWAKRMQAKHRFADGREYTGEQVFAMLLNLGTDTNETKMVEGMTRGGRQGWTRESVLAFVHQVFPDQAPYKFAEAVHQYISRSDLWKDSADVKEAISGVRPEAIEAKPILTPDGTTIAGGYYPLVYDNRAPLTDAEVTAADALMAMHGANMVNQYATNGFTRQRTGYVAPLLLDTRALAAHLYEVDHFISNAEGIIARHKLLNNPAIKGLIVRSIGWDAWHSLKASNNYIASDGYLLTGEMLQTTGALSHLLFGNAIVTMGGNLLSGINQIVNGVPATLAQMGPGGWASFSKALVDFAKSPMSVWHEMNTLLGELEGMEFNYDRDLRMLIAKDLTDTGGFDRYRRAFATTAMYPVLMGQKVVNVITGKAAYDLARKQGKTIEEAKAFANMTIRQSQSSAGPKDMTAVQRSPDMALRMLTALASYTFTLNDLVMPRRLKKDELVGSMGRLMVLVIAGAVTKELFDLMFPKLAEKDDERKGDVEKGIESEAGWAAAALFRSSMEAVGNVPIAGRLVAALLTGRPGKITTIPDTIALGLKALPGLASGEGLTKKEAKAAVDALGIITMLPTRGALFGPGEFMYEYVNGNMEENPYAILQELLLVRPGQKGDK